MNVNRRMIADSRSPSPKIKPGKSGYTEKETTSHPLRKKFITIAKPLSNKKKNRLLPSENRRRRRCESSSPAAPPTPSMALPPRTPSAASLARFSASSRSGRYRFRPHWLRFSTLLILVLWLLWKSILYSSFNLMLV